MFDYFFKLFKYYGFKKMKTFKAEKEILEEFFKNKKINEICDGLPLREDVYNIH